MKWMKQTPTEPGLYLRNNPPVSAICKAWLVEIDGILNYVHPEGALIRVSKEMAHFWWYGPIPVLPDGISHILRYGRKRRSKR